MTLSRPGPMQHELEWSGVRDKPLRLRPWRSRFATARASALAGLAPGRRHTRYDR
jgi:hypothetical protein